MNKFAKATHCIKPKVGIYFFLAKIHCFGLQNDQHFIAFILKILTNGLKSGARRLTGESGKNCGICGWSLLEIFLGNKFLIFSHMYPFGKFISYYIITCWMHKVFYF
jgi:hypothetical protein